MSRDLMWARSYLREAERAAVHQNPNQYHVNKEIHGAIQAILNHLESQPVRVGEVDCQQETPQSEVSSVPKIGIAGKPLQLPSVSLDFKQGLFRLTVTTGEYSRSTSFTWDEWVAIQQLFSTPLPTCGSLTTSGEIKAGDRGPASREPAPSVPSESPPPAASGAAGRCRARNLDNTRCEREYQHDGPHLAGTERWVAFEPEDYPVTSVPSESAESEE